MPREPRTRSAPLLPSRCVCGTRIDYTTDGQGHVVAAPCGTCERRRWRTRWIAERTARERARAAERQALLATLGALIGRLYATTVTPLQHQRGAWRRTARRAAAKRKALGLPRAETPTQKAQRRAGVAALRSDPVYKEIERLRRRERAEADRAAGITRPRTDTKKGRAAIAARTGQEVTHG